MTEVAKAPARVGKGLYSKLAEVMGIVDRIPKNGRNLFHGYDYATEADITSAVRKGMADRFLVMVPNITKVEWAQGDEAGKKQKLCTLTVRFDVHDGESGEAMSFEVLGQGQDGGDKATYKALTGATKYALLKLFLIPTGDDPEREDAASAAPNNPAPPTRVEALKQRVAPSPPPPALTQQELPGAPGPRPQAVTIRFGKGRGQTSHQLDDSALAFYVRCAQEAVDDPEKARFLQANTLELAALQGEQRWRAGAR